jgi:hypothetical protein
MQMAVQYKPLITVTAFCWCDFRLPPWCKLVTNVLEPTGYPKTSLTNYQSELHNILEEQKPAFCLLYLRENVAN